MRKIGVTLPLLLAASVLLAGCSAQLLPNQISRQFDSKDEVSDLWEGSADWLPTDSTDIRIVESRNHDTAVLAADSSTDLDSSGCVDTERKSGPAFEATWSPENVYVDRVFICGTWAVMKTDDGWYGWTPVDPDERG